MSEDGTVVFTAEQWAEFKGDIEDKMRELRRVSKERDALVSEMNDRIAGYAYLAAFSGDARDREGYLKATLAGLGISWDHAAELAHKIERDGHV